LETAALPIEPPPWAGGVPCGRIVTARGGVRHHGSCQPPRRESTTTWHALSTSPVADPRDAARPRLGPVNRIAARIAAINESATLKVDAKAKSLKAAGRDVISYAAGEPDFATPPNIVEAAQRALADPKNYRYTPAAGLPELREAVAAKTLRDAGLEVEPSQVLVTSGGKQSVYQAFQTILDPGDEVLVPTPYWPTY